MRARAPKELCAERRARLAASLPGERIVIPAGRPARSRFRPAGDHVYLTGNDSPGSVLVLDGADAVLYINPPSSRETLEFFNDPEGAELWLGRRPPLAAVADALGLECKPLAGLALSPSRPTRVLRGVDAVVDAAAPSGDAFRDRELRALLSELRLVKDAWEIEQIEAAVAVTIAGFEDVGRAIAPGASERDVETAFESRARRDGNGVSFNTIVGAGAHATTLHWEANDGKLRAGELVLVDAGAESRTFYAGDVTRTYPVDGTFTTLQRDALELLNDAHEAALAAAVPGASYRAAARAVAEVVARGLVDLRVLPENAERDPESGHYRRFTIHGPGHMLGLDVHDCADARAGRYLDGTLEAGHVLTIEPGLYFQPDDETIPAELRGLGLRVEDDVVVTESGNRVLSERLPRRPADVEAWLATVRER